MSRSYNHVYKTEIAFAQLKSILPIRSTVCLLLASARGESIMKCISGTLIIVFVPMCVSDATINDIAFVCITQSSLVK